MITWVAEIASSHKGEKALAYEMIRQYAQAGAGIIKFQFGWTEEAQNNLGLSYNPIRYIDDWAEELAGWCDMYDVQLMASIWSLDGLETAKSVGMSCYKIAHQLWSKDRGLAALILAEGKPTYVSGESDHKNAIPIFATHKYPTYPRDIELPDFNTSMYYGYSDHAHGIDACLLAVARGALYIEKHVALDKTDLCIRDTTFSASPDEYRNMVAIGNGIRRLLDAES